MTLAHERYRKGLTSFLDVLTAENSLYTAQSNLSKSEANLLTDLISLYKALGGAEMRPMSGWRGPGYTGDEALRKFPVSQPELRVTRTFGQTGNNRKPGV